ncbi:MAG: CBS domain-containing protein [Planctomycetes bacterium]|nr:CBS domain-containing protein [Planctomycetota bacterium]
MFEPDALVNLGVPEFVEPGFLLGLMLLAAIAGGYSARLLRVPKVVGYLVGGLALRFVLVTILRRAEGNGDPDELVTHAARSLQAIKPLALGLIMFSLGGVFEVRHLKAVGPKVLRISILEVGCVLALVGLGCTLVSLIGHSTSGRAVAFGVLLGVVAVATAPAATLLVLREYGAKGPLSDAILTLTALNNIVCIIFFHALFMILAATGVIDSAGAGGRFVILDLLTISVGSAALGTVLAFCFSVVYSKVTLPEFVLVFFAVLLGLGAGQAYLADVFGLSFNFLLTSLICGAVFANITIDQDPLHEALRTMGGPIFAAFFVLAGYELHIGELGALGVLGAVYVLARTAGKYLGGRLGVRWARLSDGINPHIGLGLLCQAGVAIGLADFLYKTWGTSAGGVFTPDPLAVQFKTVVLGSVVLFELTGPLVLRTMAVKGGEVKAVTLLRRVRAAAAEGDSVTRLTWDALLRTFGLSPSVSRDAQEALQTRDIMRANVKFLRASAKLDEVLHFVERSRFNHFPVVDDDGDFLGMIHFADLRGIIYDPFMRDLVTAVDLAAADTPTVSAEATLEELLEVFEESGAASLAVTESGISRRVIGLVEQRDLLRALYGPDKSAAR